MLRDLPSLQPQPDIEIFMSTPDAEDEPLQTSTPNVDPFDDVFGSAPPSPDIASRAGNNRSLNESSNRPGVDHSDIPRLRSIHVTNGYREGIAASKEKHIQEGFDEGYALGAEVALKAGRLIGTLEGLYHAVPRETASTPGDATSRAGGYGSRSISNKEELRTMLRAAEQDLKVEKLFARDYFGEDGIWLYEVPGQENESEITFAKVAEAHPVVKAWSGRVKELCKTLKVNLDRGW